MRHRIIEVNLIIEGYSPRRNYKGKEELKRSIEREGLIEPLLVWRDGDTYPIIDGNRRFRAVKELGWKSVECIIEDADEEKSYRLSYIKNTERENFNPIEESVHLQTVIDKFGNNVEDLVRKGYAPHRSTIDDKLRLLTLPADMQQSIIDGTLEPSKGYELAKVEDEKSQRELFDKTVAEGLAVRDLKREIHSRNVRRKREEEENLPSVEVPQGDIPGVFFKDSSDMSEIKDEKVALIVTSPGYCVGMEYEQGVILKEHLKNLKQHCREWNRVLMQGGTIAINFGDIHNFRTQNGGKVEIQLIGHYYQTFLRKYNIRLRDIIAWRKGKTWINNPQVSYHQKTRHTSYRILNNFEYIYVFYKEGIRQLPADIENESKISKEEWKEWVDGVWEIPPVRSQKGHPAQFPEEIPRRLIRMYSYKGDIVLDPFGGSMTTVKVANELGRIGIGYEKEEKYKPVIMEKLGIKEDDLKKPEVEDDRGTHGGAPDFNQRFETAIVEILTENGKTAKDVASVRVPFKADLTRDEIKIEWANDDEEPDPSGPTASPQILRADDYESQNGNHIETGTASSSCPEITKGNSQFVDRIVCGDCFKLIKEIEDNSIDLCLTSPPYADTKSYGTDVKTYHPDEYVDWILPLLGEIARVLKPTGSFILNINDRIVNKQRHTYVHELIVRAAKATQLRLYDEYVWDKPTALPNGNSRRLNNVTEYLIHFCKDQNKLKWNMDAVREPYDENTVKRCQYPVGSFKLEVDRKGLPKDRTRKIIQLNKKGKVPSNVFHFPTASAVRGKKHPAAFHPDLPSWFIRALTDEGDLVLEPFAGSGTTCMVAEKLNRKFIGIELNEEYHEIAEKKVNNVAMKKAA
jgi:site-specific DNA-methyltransferase (adenine-specific)